MMPRRPASGSLLVLLVPLVLLLLFPIDFAPGRYLVTYRADRFEPWGPPRPGPSFNSDCLRSYYPRRVMTDAALEAGRIPLWDLSSFCGQPYLANYQSGVFYPVNLLLLPFSPERSLGLSVWIHLMIAGIGGMLLLRGLGLSPGVALIGGLLYAANGALAVRTGQVTMLATPAWIPLVLHLARRTARGAGALPLALAYFCMVLSGFPPILLWATLLAAAWTLHEWLACRREAGPLPLLRAGAGFLLGAGLAGVQLVPTAEFLLHSDRVRFTYQELLSSSWHPAALLRLVVPDWFGSPMAGDSWIELLSRGDGHYYQSYLSTAAYVGIGTLVFFALGARGAWRNRSARFLLIAGAGAALVLLGTPLLRLVAAVPGFAGSRVDRIVHIFVVALIVPAAFGIERSRGAFPRAIPAAALLALALLVALLWGGGDAIAERLVRPGLPRPSIPGLAAERHAWAALFLAGTAALLFLPGRFRASRLFLPLAGFLLVADAGFRAKTCHVAVGAEALPRETPETNLLGDLAEKGRVVRFRALPVPPSLPGVFGIEDVEGYNALTIKDYRAFYGEIEPEAVKERRINPLSDPAALASPLLSALSARWILTDGPLPAEGYPLRFEGRFRVYENPAALPRAYLAERIEGAPRGPEEALALLSSSPPGEKIAVLEGALPPIPSGSASEETSGEWLRAHGGGETSLDPGTPLAGIVRFAERRPERLVIDYAAREGGLLVLTDSFYPGWVAEVDGRREEILRANRIFRAVAVPPGVHRVVFAYRPASLRAGALLSLLSVGAIVAVWLSNRLRARRVSR